MRSSARLGILAVTLLAAACGDDGGSTGEIDAGTEAGAIDAGASDIDAGMSTAYPDAGAGGQDASSGTAGPGQPCNIIPDGGGPVCNDGLECCDDNVCRAPDGCGSGGYLACDCTDDCQGSICCDAPSMQFCTKRSACKSYGGTEVTTCP
jgi:hypothetical protein